MARLLLVVLLVLTAGCLGDSRQCLGDSHLLDQAAANGSRWALDILDARTRAPGAGSLGGHTKLLGAFDQCVAAHGVAGGREIRGRYCLAHVTVHGAGRYVAVSGRALRWSWCSPSSCGPSDVAAELTASIPSLLGGTVNVSVSDADCSTAERKALGSADLAFVILATCFGLAVIASTVYDRYNNRKTDKVKLVLQSFSLTSNGRALFRTSPSGLLSVHGVKFLSMAWVVVFHKYAIMGETPAINSDIVDHGLRFDWTQMPVSNGGSLAVNSFLVVSGLLAALSFMRERAAGRSFSLPNLYLHRYIRLTPLYAVVVFLYATVMPHLGSGPLWHALMDEQARRCQVSWWRNLLYINNFQSPNDSCIVQSWYLSCDTQLHWAAPLLLYPLFRWPRLGRALLVTTLVVSIAVPFSLTYFLDLPWADARNVREDVRSFFFPFVYAAPYARAGPFLVGVALGCFLFKISGIKIQLGKVTVWSGWFLTTLVALAVLYTPHVFYIRQYDKLEAAFFGALYPTAWALVVAWVIFSCEKGYAGPVYRLLGWSGWQPLSRLSYSAYLLHFLIFFYELGVQRAAVSYDHYFVVCNAIADVAIVLILSTVFTLVFEMPILNLDKLWFTPGDGGKKNITAAATLKPPPLCPPKEMCDNPAFEPESSNSQTLHEVYVKTST